MAIKIGVPSGDFPGGSDGKASAYNAGDLGSIPGSGRSPGEGTGNPLQSSCLEIPHGQRRLAGYSPWGWASLVAETVMSLSTMQETWVQSLGWEGLLEKEMAAHSSILAWKIPWISEPGRLPSLGSQRVGHD